MFPEYKANDNCKAEFNPVDTSGMFRAQRQKVRERIGLRANQIIFMVGNKQEERTYSDTDILFRQDSSFLYLTGFNQPDSSIAIDLLTGESTLFVRRKSRSELIFDGGYDDFEAIKVKHEVDDVVFIDEADEYISDKYPGLNTIYTINSAALLDEVPEFDEYTINQSVLLGHIRIARQVKTEQEIAISRVSTLVTSTAHEAIMKGTRIGMLESDVESLFL